MSIIYLPLLEYIITEMEKKLMELEFLAIKMELIIMRDTIKQLNEYIRG